MRVLKRISDGKIIEAQGGYGDLSVLVSNAVSSGYSQNEIEALEMDDVDFKFALANQQASERTYADKRRAEYPSVGEQLDSLYQAGIFPPDMAAKIEAVKLKYPKGE